MQVWLQFKSCSMSISHDINLAYFNAYAIVLYTMDKMLPESDVSDLFLSSSTFFTLSSISVSLDSMHQFPLLVFLDITTVKASSDPLSKFSISTSLSDFWSVLT